MKTKLLTAEIAQRLPKHDDVVSLDHAVVQCKFFVPGTLHRWYVLTGEPTKDGNWNFLGYATCDSDGGEFGGFTLSELESIEGPFGVRVERDLYFEPVPISSVTSGQTN